jgi:hypothetical protein
MSHFGFKRLSLQFALALLASAALAGPRGTTITGTKTAESSATETIDYDWTIEKSNPPDQVPYVIPLGETQAATFSITVTRLEPTVTWVNGAVSGEICLNNTGSASTRGLQLRDVLQVESSPGVWTDVTPVTVIPVGAQIPAGETRCYPYSFDIELERGKSYRNLATAAIDNFYGYEGSPHEIEISTAVVINETTIINDEEVEISDIFECPTGFTCTPLTQSWTATGSIVIPVSIEITNNEAECDQTFRVVNTATLEEIDSGIDRDSSAEIDIFSGSCTALGCVGSYGYWKSPNGQERLAELVPGSMVLGSNSYTASQIVAILESAVATPGPGANALVQLAHQLIAAKLNLLNGASSGSVATFISTADGLIGSTLIPPIGSTQIATSSPVGEEMVSTAVTLESYNTGELGVPYCGTTPAVGR